MRASARTSRLCILRAILSPSLVYFCRVKPDSFWQAPQDIDRYDASGYEIWYFGSSTVKIDARTRRVMEWDNNGNLKVQLLPGGQTTSSTSFSRGSHQDDVLRLQGTPTDIDRYDASGYEVWYFGSSTVKIDSRSRRVLEWDNNGNLKVRL